MIWPTPYVPPFLRSSSRFASRCTEIVLFGFNVVNVVVLVGVVELDETTLSVYFVLNASTLSAVQLLPSAEIVPGTDVEP